MERDEVTPNEVIVSLALPSAVLDVGLDWTLGIGKEVMSVADVSYRRGEDGLQRGAAQAGQLGVRHSRTAQPGR